MFTYKPFKSPDTGEVGKPITIATNVESVSCPSRSSKYLGAALWLNCGMRGMRVWLPLHGSKEDLSSRRTLVTVKQNVYPLVVHHHEAAILGIDFVDAEMMPNTVVQQSLVVLNRRLHTIIRASFL